MPILRWYSLHPPSHVVVHKPNAIARYQRHPPLVQTAHMPCRNAQLARCSPHWFLADSPNANMVGALRGKSQTGASYPCQKTIAKSCLKLTVNGLCLCPIVFGQYWSRLPSFSNHPLPQLATHLDRTADATSVSAFSARPPMSLKLLRLPPLQSPFLLSQLVRNSQTGFCVENTRQSRLSKKMKVIHSRFLTHRSDPNRFRLDCLGKLSSSSNTRSSWTTLPAIC